MTIDAMGCQGRIIEDIVDGGGDYAIAVKGNQGHLHDSVVDFFTAAQEHAFHGVNYQYHETIDKGHGRVEIRRYWSSNDLNSIHKPEKWKKLHAIGMVESEPHEGDKTSTEKRYYILSFNDVALFAKAVRLHRGIENKVHWIMDVTFREDESRIRRNNGAHNMGVIRHMSLNLLKHEKSKRSISGKRLRAAFNDDFRDKVLCGL